jgi:CubicO group peptidase (beta-lactamase class C family)
MKKMLMLFAVIAGISVNMYAQELDKKINTLIEKAVELNRFNGSVLVSKNGKIIFEAGYGFQDVEKKIVNTPNTVYQIGSTTKEFTAAVILKLEEDNKLSLEDKLSKFFPKFKRGDEITIKNLLTHTSGLYEILRDPIAFNEGSQPRSKEKMLSYFADKPLYFNPGTQYSYCNSGYMMLGLIIEKVTGKSYEQVVKDLILQPLEMTHSGFDFAGLKSPYKAIGYTKYTNTIKEPSIPWDSTATYSAGALYSTVGDLYKWHNGLLSYKIYNKSSLEKATTPFLEGYGLGCWIDTILNKKVVSHGGNILGFTGYFGRIQEEDVCIILLNNIFNRQIETIGHCILAILYDKPYSYFDEIKLPNDDLQKFVGQYQVNADYIVKITRIENRLFIERNKKSKVEIFADKETSFFQKDDDIRISFKIEMGKIKSLTIAEGLSTKRGDKIN